MLQSCYAACTAPDPGDPRARPFTAQAIIANPPSYGHIHCAEKLGVPLHLVGGRGLRGGWWRRTASVAGRVPLRMVRSAPEAAA